MKTMYDLKQLLIDFPSQPPFVLGYDDPPTMEYFQKALSVIKEGNKERINGVWYVSINGIIDLVEMLKHHGLGLFLEKMSITIYQEIYAKEMERKYRYMGS
jgi:hypothetical protein